MDNEIDLSSAEGPTPEPIVETKEPGPGALEGEYKPNFAFKVKDQDYEFDPRVRSAVTSKDAEDHIRDLYTKAYGLDGIKARAEDYEKKWGEEKGRFSSLQTEYKTWQSRLQKINELRENDFGTFQKVWQIPDSAIINRAREILAVKDDPSSRASLDQIYSDRMAGLRNADLLDQQAQTNSAMVRQLHEMKMTGALSTPDILQFQSEYDRRMGQGAFRREVDDYGTLQYHSSGGRYIEPQVAVSQTLQRLKTMMGPLTTPPPPAREESEPDAGLDPLRIAPLPNLGPGKTGAPVPRKNFKSVKEMRDYAKTLE